MEWRLGLKVVAVRRKFAAICLHTDHAPWHRMRHKQVEQYAAALSLQMQGCIDVRNIRHTNLADRIPELAEGLGLTWSEKREVRLIVGINASHQLGTPGGSPCPR